MDMMKKLNLCVLAALALPVWASAQSSVTIYGVLDAGLTSVSNQIGANGQGGHNVVLDTGILTPNLIGFRGSEDLGGGLKAVYLLESQFALDNGATIGSGLFTRQSYVGLSGPWGTLTAGDQYEFMFEALTVRRLGPVLPYISLYNFQQGPFQALGTNFGGFDFNRLAGGFRVANSLKYVSNPVGGFTLGGMYGLGEATGSTAQNSTSSLGANYDGGNFGLAAAYTNARQSNIDNGNSGIRNFGLGGRYQIGSVNLDALYTNTKNTLTNGKVSVYEIGVTVPVAAATTVRVDDEYMKGNAQLANDKANQAGVTLDYAFSKRTDVYASVIYQKASGDDHPDAFINGLSGNSSSGTQSALRIGMRHFF
jgi:predicted porin